MQDYIKGEHHWTPHPIPDYYSSRCASFVPIMSEPYTDSVIRTSTCLLILFATAIEAHQSLHKLDSYEVALVMCENLSPAPVVAYTSSSEYFPVLLK